MCASPTRMIGHSICCSGCGWNKVLNQSAQAHLQKHIAKGVLAAGLALMFAVIYVGHFGAYSLKILPLKVQQWTSQLDKSSHARLVGTCLQLKQYDCVEKAHQSYFHSSRDVEILSELAAFQTKRNKKGEALQTYQLYFKNKGRGFKPAYHYARLLEEQGQNQAALKYYEYALHTGATNQLRVSVMRAYINFLVESGKAQKARFELAKLKNRVKNSSALVQQEYSRWQAQVRKG